MPKFTRRVPARMTWNPSHRSSPSPAQTVRDKFIAICGRLWVPVREGRRADATPASPRVTVWLLNALLGPLTGAAV
jgi:hypothetical protein